MRWKISPRGHDPRQIDLLAIIALAIVIVAAFVLIAHYDANPQGTTAFIVPSQNVRW